MRVCDENRQSKRGGVRGLVIASLLLFLLLALAAAANYINARWKINLSIPAFFLYVIIGVFVFRKMVVEYRYTLESNRFIIEQLSGARSKKLLDIRVSDINAFFELKDGVKAQGRRLKMYTGEPKGLYALHIEQEEKPMCVVVKPSEVLVEKLKQICG